MAARTKAQEIIDSNAVGKWIPSMLGILNDTPLTQDSFYSCLLQVVLPLLQVR